MLIKMICRKFSNRTINFNTNEKCSNFSKSCEGCPQPHTDTNAEIDLMIKNKSFMPLRHKV